MNTTLARKEIRIGGVVQGVGFRPHVYRTAARFHITGHVLNSADGVVIEAEAAESRLIHEFLDALRNELPPLARMDVVSIADLHPLGEQQFKIRHSSHESGGFALVPPDVSSCVDCMDDVSRPGDRRYGYPFTNCTNCGPRYSIIRDIPYDRAETTMDGFTMCPACQAEYDDPGNRRFHAEPNACPECGPGLALLSAAELARIAAIQYETGAGSARILSEVRQLLGAGEILTIKGLGGFHLVCDAANDQAVTLLRLRKRRNGKAFAIMSRDLDVAGRICNITTAEAGLLVSSERPIVLLQRRIDAEVAAGVAPGNSRLGVMLPYTPLHHLLFEGAPYEALVMTSGNQSEEPIVYRNEDAGPRLGALADYFLLHNRPIQTRVDDSVVQCVEDRAYPIRRSRGFVPQSIDLGPAAQTAEILACGGELKNTFCLTKGHLAIVSQHIGDLENLETMEFFRETLAQGKRFFRVSPVAVAHDLHPGYLSTRYALEESGLKAIGVQHHHAHIASCMADNGLAGSVIGVAFDGTGYGTDGKIWGAEFLTCDFAGFERRGHFAYIGIPGGDRAIRQPWRSGLAQLNSAFGSEAADLSRRLFPQIPAYQLKFVQDMIEHQVQTIETSSCGRLFDAVASILGVRQECSYEGQAAIELEAISAQMRAGAEGDLAGYAVEFTEGRPFRVDLRGAIRAIVFDCLDGVAAAAISARFHRTVGEVVIEGCERIRRESPELNRVCLSGGTFQNLRLLRHAMNGLRERGFEVFIHRQVPANDGGLSLGQAVIANAALTRENGRNSSLSHVRGPLYDGCLRASQYGSMLF